MFWVVFPTHHQELYSQRLVTPLLLPVGIATGSNNGCIVPDAAPDDGWKKTTRNM